MGANIKLHIFCLSPWWSIKLQGKDSNSENLSKVTLNFASMPQLLWCDHTGTCADLLAQSQCLWILYRDTSSKPLSTTCRLHECPVKQLWPPLGLRCSTVSLDMCTKPDVCLLVLMHCLKSCLYCLTIWKNTYFIGELEILGHGSFVTGLFSISPK